MQAAVPSAIDFSKETQQTRQLYGLDQDSTKVAGERLLAARRLVEQGVRFIQVFPSAYGVWDSHQKLKDNHTRLCATVDQPVAGLIQDLRQRGLLDRTLVVFCTEFGRTPGWSSDRAELTAGTTIRTASPSGWPVPVSNAVLYMVPPMNLAIMPSGTATT